VHVSETPDSWKPVVEPLEAVISIRFSRSYKREFIREFEGFERLPCGGGVEYLHRNPASRRRRRKKKSRI
jgi:hypothetical protein